MRAGLLLFQRLAAPLLSRRALGVDLIGRKLVLFAQFGDGGRIDVRHGLGPQFAVAPGVTHIVHRRRDLRIAQDIERRHFGVERMAVDVDLTLEPKQHHARRKIRAQEDVAVARERRKLSGHALAFRLMTGRALLVEHGRAVGFFGRCCRRARGACLGRIGPEIGSEIIENLGALIGRNPQAILLHAVEQVAPCRTRHAGGLDQILQVVAGAALAVDQFAARARRQFQIVRDARLPGQKQKADSPRDEGRPAHSKSSPENSNGGKRHASAPRRLIRPKAAGQAVKPGIDVLFQARREGRPGKDVSVLTGRARDRNPGPSGDGFEGAVHARVVSVQVASASRTSASSHRVRWNSARSSSFRVSGVICRAESHRMRRVKRTRSATLASCS